MAPSTSTTTISGAQVQPVPAGVTDGALQDDAQGQRIVSDYLAEPLPDRDAVINRGQSLIYVLTSRGASDSLLGQIREETRRQACSAMVVNAAFDRDYLPPRTTLAFDLQPVDGVLARGFTPVAPGDPRITAGQALNRDGTAPLVGDSVLGLTAFSTPVSNGRWRVVLFTDKLGPNAGTLPFGRTITANGVRVLVADLAPARWLTQGYLTDKVVLPMLASAGASGPGGAPLLMQNDLLNVAGGAIEFEVDVVGGRLTLTFGPPATLSGVVLEPADSRSSLQLVGAARGAPAIIDDCFNYEQQLVRPIAHGTPYLGSPLAGTPGGGGGLPASAH